ncbi:trace amine-associated receptor 3-like [Ruditapes philippinarum]|uniref:trace amine-associated receptor 3-like n=1 Tax=Ruditapes philippinarum TaxID=129788 RepID=UPI00295BD56A|nr:trace amine-associated receptor 3-like [Ruditapes philippinarum]
MENTTIGILNLLNSSNGENNGTYGYPMSPIEPEYFNIYNIYLYLMIIFGVSGNIIVLVVFFYNPPSNTTDWFIFTITVCDFISSSVNVPVYATFTNGFWRVYGTTLICRLHMFLSQSIVLSSSFLICGLALDRYLKVCRQLSSFTTARARNVCVVISLLTTALSAPASVMFENRAGRCVSIVMDNTLFAYYLLVFLIFICAAIIVVFSYCNVTKTVLDSEANVARHANRTYNLNRRNKTFCCCIPSCRKGKVAPSLSQMSRNRPSRDGEQSVGARHVIIEDNKDIIQDQRQIHMQTISDGQITATITQSQPSDRTTDNCITRPTASNNTSTQRRTSSQRTTQISFLVCTVFILSWIPPWLCFILASIPGTLTDINVVKFMLFGRMTYLVNGFSNPIIYTLLNKKFRTRILEIFCCKRM